MERKLVLSFSPDSTERPITYELVKEYDIKINIVKAEIEIGKGGKLLMVMDAPEENIARAIEYLKRNNITVSPVSNKIYYNESLCTDCGSCASSCPAEALTIGAPDWKLKFNPEKCIMCKLCLKSCPLKLFSVEFAQ